MSEMKNNKKNNLFTTKKREREEDNQNTGAYVPENNINKNNIENKNYNLNENKTDNSSLKRQISKEYYEKEHSEKSSQMEFIPEAQKCKYIIFNYFFFFLAINTSDVLASIDKEDQEKIDFVRRRNLNIENNIINSNKIPENIKMDIDENDKEEPTNNVLIKKESNEVKDESDKENEEEEESNQDEEPEDNNFISLFLKNLDSIKINNNEINELIPMLFDLTSNLSLAHESIAENQNCVSLIKELISLLIIYRESEISSNIIKFLNNYYF